jgi:hypothetical protein
MELKGIAFRSKAYQCLSSNNFGHSRKEVKNREHSKGYVINIPVLLINVGFF